MTEFYELAKKADRFGFAPGRANVYLTFREKGLLLMSGVLESAPSHPLQRSGNQGNPPRGVILLGIHRP